MNKWLWRIDAMSTFMGKTFSWLIVVLTLHVSWEVVARYLFNQPSSWAFDLHSMYYGIMFMMAGAYTLAKNGHVRGDILYGYLPPRAQAWIDLILYVAFFIPGVTAMVWAGWTFAADSIAIKAFIPVAGFFLLLQGFAEIVRCVMCLQSGSWPEREADVQEVDVEKLKELVHVKDEDIKSLDRYVVGKEHAK